MNAYWTKRFLSLESRSHTLSTDDAKSVVQIFNTAEAQIRKTIRSWLQRYADATGSISMADAKKMLTDDEMQELKWTLDDYIKYGEANAINQKYMKQLEIASAKHHVSRFTALMTDCNFQLVKLYEGYESTIHSALEKAYTNSYLNTSFELSKGLNVGFKTGIDKPMLDQILDNPWTKDKVTFSTRIWKDQAKLQTKLYNEITNMCLTGDDPEKAINNIANDFGTSKSNAKRLVQTEEAFYSSAAQKSTFNDYGLDKYEIVATLDSRTSDICRSMDGKIFNLKDYKPGLNAPPFHPNCRTTTVPYIDNNPFTDDGYRAARHNDKDLYYVPNDMTYKEWKSTFVDGNGLDKMEPFENKKNKVKTFKRK